MRRGITSAVVPALLALGLPLVVAAPAAAAVPHVTESQRIAAPPQPNSTGVRPGFGQQVAVSASGSTMLVGAPAMTVGTAPDAGSAYLYRRGASGTWTLIQTFAPPTSFASGEFGTSVALSADGTTAVIGQGNYAGTGLPGSWSGTYYQGGVAWAYRETAGTWSSGAPLVKPLAATSEQTQYYAQAVAVTRDGLHAAVTLPGANAAVDWFSYAAGAWTRDQRVLLNPAAGVANPSLAVATDGVSDHLFVGWDSPGVVYALTKGVGAATWSGISETLMQPGGAAGTGFGSGVAASADGSTLVVGASEAAKPTGPTGWGVAYVYTANGSAHQLATTLYGSDTAGTSHFGQDVAINGTGTRVVVGGWVAPQASYLFFEPASGWPAGPMSETAALAMSDTTARDSYGNGIGISDDSATPPTSIIGLGNGISPNPAGSTTAWSQGALYVYGITSVADKAPVATSDSYTTAAGTTLVVAAPGVLGNDTDADGDALSATKVSDPAHGTLTLNRDGSFSYAPAAGYSGSDSFTYTANDGTTDSNVATVTVAVSAAANHPPVAASGAYTTAENTALTVAAPGVLGNDTDVDGDTLTASVVTGPAHGTVSLSSNGAFTYSPAAGFTGVDTFTYRAADATAGSGVTTVSITVQKTDDAPVAANDAYQVARNKALVVSAPGVLHNDKDPDGDALTAAVVAGPAHGTLSLSAGGGFTYTPAAGYLGNDSFTYRASDGTLASNVATVTLIVRTPTTLSVSVSKTIITYGDGVVVKTMLKKSGAAQGSKSVTLQRCPWTVRGAQSSCGTWQPIKTVRTARNGAVTYLDHPARNVRYRWTYAGTSTVAAAMSSEKTVLVRTRTSLKVSKTRVALKTWVTVTVEVHPEHGAQVGYVQRYYPGSGWADRWVVTPHRVNATTSRATFQLRWLQRGTFKYRFVMRSHGCHELGYSKTVTVKAV